MLGEEAMGQPLGRVDAGGFPPTHSVSVNLLEGCGMVVRNM